MWLHFFLQNFHFAINLIAAFVFAAVCWLYVDAWKIRKDTKGLIRYIGFAFLSISFLLRSIIIESDVILFSFWSQDLGEIVSQTTKLIAYSLIVWSTHLDPILPVPDTSRSMKLASAFIPMIWVKFMVFMQPVLALTIAILYFRRATTGLERHLKRVAWSFVLLALYEVLSIGWLFSGTTNPGLYTFLSPFGALWILRYIILTVLVIILGSWVFSYLLKRIQTQLFIIFSTSIMFIFLLVTVAFTSFLLQTIQRESLKQMETDSKVFNLSIKSLGDQMLSDSLIVAQNSNVKDALIHNSRKSMVDFLESFLLTKRQSSLVIVDQDGKVFARGEEIERYGESLSEDPFVKAILGDKELSTINVRDGNFAPEVSINSGSPIKSGNRVIGAVIITKLIDSTFVDGLKSTTGLEISIYGYNILSATTLTNSSNMRYIGLQENTKQVISNVLDKNLNFTGTMLIQNIPYSGVFSPLEGIEGNPVGMLFIGKKQIMTLQIASNAVAYTFILSITMLIILLGPIFLISRYISLQFR